MRVAAIYDIHGNLPALEAVLQEIGRADVDLVVVGGDVLPGPMPRECLTRLLDIEQPVQFLLGNGDREVLAQMAGTETDWYRTAPELWRVPVRWTAQQLDREHERLLAGWPGTIRIEVQGFGTVLFCHATPRNDTDVITRLTPEENLLPMFKHLEVSAVVCGHTHMQFDRTVGQIRVLNAGSVGMPVGAPGAYWLLFSPSAGLQHTTYDLLKAAERIRKTKYPQAQEFAMHSVLQPPDEQTTMEALGRAEPTLF